MNKGLLFFVLLSMFCIPKLMYSYEQLCRACAIVLGKKICVDPDSLKHTRGAHWYYGFVKHSKTKEIDCRVALSNSEVNFLKNEVVSFYKPSKVIDDQVIKDVLRRFSNLRGTGYFSFDVKGAEHVLHDFKNRTIQDLANEISQ